MGGAETPAAPRPPPPPTLPISSYALTALSPPCVKRKTIDKGVYRQLDTNYEVDEKKYYVKLLDNLYIQIAF